MGHEDVDAENKLPILFAITNQQLRARIANPSLTNPNSQDMSSFLAQNDRLKHISQDRLPLTSTKLKLITLQMPIFNRS